jgi:hypothetical protein
MRFRFPAMQMIRGHRGRKGARRRVSEADYLLRPG